VTAILQQGDKVHVTIPLITRNGLENYQATQDFADELTRTYRHYGVEVIMWSATTLSPGVLITAIFREPAPRLRKRTDGLWEEA